MNELQKRFWFHFDKLQGCGPMLAINTADREKIEVSVLNLNSHQVSKLNMTWYETNNKKGVCYSDAEAHPAMVGKVAHELDQWPSQIFFEGVQTWKKKIENGDNPEPLLAYYIGNDRQHLLLDGNHRAVAISSLDDAFVRTVEILVLKGPICEEILPDLIHFR